MMDIENIFCEIMELDKVPNDFNDLSICDIEKWDSLSNMLFLMALEKSFEIRFTFDEMSELTSIKAIKKRLNNLMS